nr:hypothetical protein [uncultured Allomuricauda sp.]
MIIILVLIASDVFFLWKIFKTIGSKKKSIPDERYFELKYNINLLKAVSAILIFLFGFLGFTTYKDITKIVESDFEKKFEMQQRRIDKLDSIVKDYEETVKVLKVEEGKSVENLNDVQREFNIINKKISNAQENLKYAARIYVVKDLEYIKKEKQLISEGVLKFYFDEMITSKGEKLPKFKERPIIAIQTISNGSSLAITQVTKEFVEVILSYRLVSRSNNDLITYKFDVWIAEPN